MPALGSTRYTYSDDAWHQIATLKLDRNPFVRKVVADFYWQDQGRGNRKGGYRLRWAHGEHVGYVNLSYDSTAPHNSKHHRLLILSAGEQEEGSIPADAQQSAAMLMAISTHACDISVEIRVGRGGRIMLSPTWAEPLRWKYHGHQLNIERHECQFIMARD